MTTFPLTLEPTDGVAGRPLQRLWRGRLEDAAWVRPVFLLSLLVMGLLYLWNLSSSGYANSFYSAAAQAGSQSWKAFFFGSLDSANAITVDKPPGALWPMDLSVRIFGLGSWQILVPQVLMGVATAAVLYAAVRRRFSAAAGLIAVAVFALTPVAALMFRFNNPDALLALLMTTTVYCVLRALEKGQTKWLVWAGVAVGVAFLVKTLQAFLILPPLAVLYAVCAPVRLRKRLGQLLLATVALVVAGGWWVAIVQLWPASSRPYIGGSQTNSFLELTFGYNGLGRISGDETGSVGGMGGPGGSSHWGSTGITRMFGDEVGSQVAWLLPAALLLLVAGLLVTRRAARTDTARGAFVAWGGSLLMTMAVFSFMAGIFHQYYTVALTPYMAALVGMGATMLWEERARAWASIALAVTVAVTGWWSYELLGRTPDYLPWLRWAVLVGGIVGAVGLALAGRTGRSAPGQLSADGTPAAAGYPGTAPSVTGHAAQAPEAMAPQNHRAGGHGRPGGAALGGRTRHRVVLVAIGISLAASLGGPLAYSLTTLNTGHAGSIVTAGPPGASMMGGGGHGGFGGPGGEGAGGPGGMRPTGSGQGGFPGQGRGQGQGQNGQGGGFGGQAPGGAGAAGQGQGRMGGAQGGFPGQGGQGGQGGQKGGGMGGGAFGGLLNGATVSSDAKSLLEKDASSYTWPAAAIGSQNAANYQLATGDPIMAIGGFNGSDPSPTLAQFQQDVADGKIHYFIAGGRGDMGARGGETAGGKGGGMGGAMGGGSRGGSNASSAISSWVEKTFKKVTVGDATFYDLTQKATS